MIVGGILGILFVTILRRVMVEDSSLPFPESVAAGEIHKAGQRGAEAAMQLFSAMGVGARRPAAGDAGIFRASNDFPIGGGPGQGELRPPRPEEGLGDRGRRRGHDLRRPAVSPAYIGVGYIIGPELGALNFAGGLLAWGLFVPLLVFFLGPQLAPALHRRRRRHGLGGLAGHLWRFIVRPIAVGGMLVGACYTLFRMRKNLISGIKRGVADVQKSATAQAATQRTERDIRSRPCCWASPSCSC